MKFQFDPKQPYQLDAINAVVGLFDGQVLKPTDYQLSIHDQSATYGMLGSIPNRVDIIKEDINKNLYQVKQKNNVIHPDDVNTRGMNFSVEMETGTGKTYVYLRTAFELCSRYGFQKFIIVVPSVAIREGVLKSIDMMKEHFRELYDNMPFNHFVYDSKKANELRHFATNNLMQLMIINIDAFNKKANNIIHDRRDRMGGLKPVEFIQATHPIVIIDEPQNMESERAKEAIESLKPLCTLRYSATHRDKYNLVYQLDPIKAFQLRLVKKISVASIISDSDINEAFIKVNSVTNKDGRIRANVSFQKQTKDGVKIASATLKQDDDLFMKSDEREMYRNGFKVIEINARPGMEYVMFSNGIRVGKGEERAGNRDAVIKEQIRQTIKAHLDKEIQVKGLGIKVLSLFFIDKVSHYRGYTKDGYVLGDYAKWFEEIYTNLIENEYRSIFIDPVPAEKVHNGYFSMDKKGGQERFVDTTGATIKDDETYNLIMKDKERLLGLDNPLKFIFSHSALREGWDNPNVFQICTIGQSKSSIKKRQEIGRGLRLPVNQNGERVFDEYINNLVVIANESYEEFAATLQKEFADDCGVIFGRLPVDAFVGLKMTKDDQEKVLTQDDSRSIWEHIRGQELVDEQGVILDRFKQAVEDMTVTVPNEFKAITVDIVKTVEQHQLERHIEDHNKKIKGRLNEKVMLDPEFEQFWRKINTKTIYSVRYSTDELIQKASERIKKMASINPQRITSTLADIDVKDSGVTAKMARTPGAVNFEPVKRVPDVLTYIQGKTELTRRTIYEILKTSQRLNDVVINPQQFMDAAVKEIRFVLNQMIVDGIKYERLEGITYEMTRLRDDAHRLNFSKDRIIPTDKSIYDYILYDSGVEKKFAESLNTMRDIKYFIKLPGWFTIPTPVGEYNPDWACQ